MNFFKRNLAVFLLIIPSIIIFSAFAYAFMKKDDATFYLKDIEGNPSALSGITISGVLQDRYHGQYFEIQNGKVNHHFKYYNKTEDALEVPINYFNGISSGDLVYWFQTSYKILPNAETRIISTESNTYGDLKNGGYTIEERTIAANKVGLIAEIRSRYKDPEKSIDRDSFSIDTGIILTDDELKYEFKETVERLPDGTEHTVYHGSSINSPLAINNSNLPYCMTVLDEKVYFTLPTTKECSGENGIFVVDEFEYWWAHDKEGKGRKIVKLDLSEHNMDIIGLKAVNGRLVLIMAIDNIFTLRMYDKEGNFIDELSFQDIDIQTIDNSSHLIYCDAFTNGNILNLSLNKGPYGLPQTKALISVEIGEKLKEKQKILNPGFNNEIIQHYNIHAKDEKLYVVTNVQIPDENSESPYDLLKPRHFIIAIYENSNLLYKGELITDADEDYEIERLKSPTGSFGYNLFDYRHFTGIEMR